MSQSVTSYVPYSADKQPAGYDRITIEAVGSKARISVSRSDGTAIVADATGEMSITSEDLLYEGSAVPRGWQQSIGLLDDNNNPFQASALLSERVENDCRLAFAEIGNFLFRKVRDNIKGDVLQLFDRVISDHVAKPSADMRPLIFDGPLRLPWRMVYVSPEGNDVVVEDSDPIDHIGAQGFLGFAGIVDFASVPPDYSHARSSPSRSPIAFYSGFHNVLNGGMPEIQLVTSSKLFGHPQVLSSSRDLLRELALSESALVYVFCHGEFLDINKGDKTQILYFDVGYNESLTADDLKRKVENRRKKVNTKTEVATVVFVNACQGGVTDAERTVIDQFDRLGVAGSTGPLVNIPVRFAGPFGAEVLRMMASGRSLSESVLLATRSFYSPNGQLSANNLLGLTFATTNGRDTHLP